VTHKLIKRWNLTSDRLEFGLCLRHMICSANESIYSKTNEKSYYSLRWYLFRF